MTMDLRREWAADQRLRGISPGSIERSLRELSYIEKALGKDPAELTRSEYRTWLGSFSPNSASFRYRCTRGFFRWLAEEGIHEESIADGIRIRIVEEPQTTATDEQISMMLESSRRSVRDHAVMCLLVATGARRSEIGLLTYGDITQFIDSGCIRISRSKTRVRISMIDQAAEKALRRWVRDVRRRLPGIEPSDGAWLVKNGPQLVGRVTYRHSNNQVSPHAIRRWFVTTVARRGMSSASIARQLGWSPGTTAAMLSTYTRATAHDLLQDEYRRVMR